MILYGIGAQTAEYSLVSTLPSVVVPPPPTSKIVVGPHPMRARGMHGLGLDSGLQNGLVIVGALAFAYFALTILAISKSGGKKMKR